MEKDLAEDSWNARARSSEYRKSLRSEIRGSRSVNAFRSHVLVRGMGRMERSEEGGREAQRTRILPRPARASYAKTIEASRAHAGMCGDREWIARPDNSGWSKRACPASREESVRRAARGCKRRNCAFSSGALTRGIPFTSLPRLPHLVRGATLAPRAVRPSSRGRRWDKTTAGRPDAPCGGWAPERRGGG